jgi:hypothetical protein
MMTLKAKNIFVEPKRRGSNSARLSTLQKGKGGAPDVMNPRLRATNKITCKEEVNGKK